MIEKKDTYVHCNIAKQHIGGVKTVLNIQLNSLVDLYNSYEGEDESPSKEYYKGYLDCIKEAVNVLDEAYKNHILSIDDLTDYILPEKLGLTDILAEDENLAEE